MDWSGFDGASPWSGGTDMAGGTGGAWGHGFAGSCGNGAPWEDGMRAGHGDGRAEEDRPRHSGWYGGVDPARAAWEGAPEPSEYAALQKKVGEVQRKLANLVGSDVGSDEVAGLVGEAESLAKALYGTEAPKEALLHVAQRYAEGGDMNEAVDFMYGEGSAAFIAGSIRAYYE